jgi:hypothetical protein
VQSPFALLKVKNCYVVCVNIALFITNLPFAVHTRIAVRHNIRTSGTGVGDLHLIVRRCQIPSVAEFRTFCLLLEYFTCVLALNCYILIPSGWCGVHVCWCLTVVYT